MENIVIVDALSTGKNYITDLMKRNFHPVVLNSKLGENCEQELLASRIAQHRQYAGIVDFIEEASDYEETLEEVCRFHPVHVIPGSELGVRLANRLASDLRLVGNPIEKLDNFIHKDAMHEALRKAGLRYIRGKIVDSIEEALEYTHSMNFIHGCVVKPVRGASSVGVYLCDNEEELLAALKESFQGVNLYGNKEKVLIQERIVGEEYIVDTVSRNGKHRFSDMWKYHKIRVQGGGIVYEHSELVTKLSTGHNRLIAYALDVADAVGYQNGAIHGEYMIDEEGPVLIEINCRVVGGNLDAAFLDSALGHHATDDVLDAYLSPQWHESMMNVPYRPNKTACIKFFLAPERISFESSPIVRIVRHLPTYYKADIGRVVSGILPRSVDMRTAAGFVYMIGEESAVKRDCEFLHKLETEYFDMVFTSKTPSRDNCPLSMESVGEIISRCGCNRSICVLTNDKTLSVKASIWDIDAPRKNTADRYNFAIYDRNYTEGEDLEQMIEDFYFLLSKLKTGGTILIPERTYWHFPCGIESCEVLCESVGLTIEAPMAKTRGVLIATRFNEI